MTTADSTTGGLTLVWLRRDFRLDDNPALDAAARRGACIPVFLHVPGEPGERRLGGASRWWLHQALDAMQQQLQSVGSRLIIRRGDDCLVLLQQLIRETGADAVYWNRLYEPAAVARDTRIKQALKDQGTQVRSCSAALLREPWTVTRKDGGHYRAFTPFWRALQALGPEAEPRPPAQPPAPAVWPDSLEPEALGLRPRIPWDGGLAQAWQPGEPSALARLDQFLAGPVNRYADDRDLPADDGTSRLSPHLHWGEISPRRIWAALRALPAGDEAAMQGRQVFLAEIGWREFAHHLLHQFPDMISRPLDRRFERFPWQAGPSADEELRAWQQGRTGIPIVDAGMRQLWHTGWMHNRVRMIVGSLLTKNLRLPWQQGEDWFRDTLVDADEASNSMGWQWIQGSGADAAPYFRIFNPVRQGERFDPEGRYVRQWLPELAKVAKPWIHTPWLAPAGVLAAAGVRLGSHYPEPIVDLAESRKAALAAFQAIKEPSP